MIDRQHHLTSYVNSVDEADAVTPFFTRLAGNSAFQNGALGVIALNAVWIGIDVDWNEPDSAVPSVVFEVADNLFAAIFTLELLVRVLAYEKTLQFFTDRKLVFWNVFDLVLVLLMDIETWIFPLIGLSLDAIRSLSAIRALRLLRLLRITRVFRTFPELGMMVKSLAAAARSVTSTFVLIICFMYMFACVVTQWWLDKADDATLDADTRSFLDEHFGSIALSMMTTFQILLIDDAFDTIRLTKRQNALMGWLLLAYMVVSVFTILNLMLGVICEIVSSTTAAESEKILTARVAEIVRSVVDDTVASELISEAAFISDVKPKLRNLKKLNPNILDAVFTLLDSDKSGYLSRDRLSEMLVVMNHSIGAEDLQNILQHVARADSAMTQAFNDLFMLQLGNNLRVALDRMFDDPDKLQRFYTFFPPEHHNRRPSASDQPSSDALFM